MKNWELLQHLDPEAPDLSYEDWGKMFHPTGAGIVVSRGPTLHEIHFVDADKRIGKAEAGDHPQRWQDPHHRERLPRS